MSLIRNLLAIIGLLAVIGVGYAAVKLAPYQAAFDSFDEKALDTYVEMAKGVVETGNAAEATVWKAKVKKGLSFDEVDETIKFVANEHNIKNVGELPLWKQVEAMTGKQQRIAKIYMYCNPLTAFKMMDYSDAYSAYLPCRVSLVEDKEGNLWIYTLNMDLMIHGGKELPPDLKKEALEVKAIMLDVLKRASSGDF
ncbi:MAG: DUF302 domain-containing protein [Hyphomicrobiales bacterium]|nr:DUF302 domain-containing protein [Hyphomicrobiales bacterium]